MLKKLEIKALPGERDLVEAFGHAARIDAPLRHISLTMTDEGFRQDSAQKTVDAYRSFLRDNQDEVLAAFNKAGVIVCTGVPSQFLGKVYPHLTVVVREQDLDLAGAVFFRTPWVKSMTKENGFRITDSMHR